MTASPEEPPPPPPPVEPEPAPEPPVEQTPPHHDNILKRMEGSTRDFVEGNPIRDPETPNEFLTQNTMKLIGKTYAFILVVLGMFLVVALIRESIVQVILPVITLVIGGVLGFLSKDILRGNNDNST
jgi:hypothetical protein